MPAKKQTRRAISIRGVTYAALRTDCATRDVSMSDYIEQLIAEDRQRRGLQRPEVAAAVAREASVAVRREGERQVTTAARAVHAATAAPAPPAAPAAPAPPRTAATTAELRALVTEETNRLIPRLPAGTSAEDLEVAGRAAAAEAVRVFDPAKGLRLVDAARPLVRRAMTDRLRDLREEEAATAAATAATTRPEPPKSVPVVATAAAATTTATVRRPEFRLKDGEVSIPKRIWEWLETQPGAVSVSAAASAVGCPHNVAGVAFNKWKNKGLVEGHPGAYRISNGSASAPEPKRDEPPKAPSSTCPCCGRKPLGPGMRCGACALACRPDGAGGWRRGDQCPAAPVVEAAPTPLPRESSIKAGPPPEQTAMLGRRETPARSAPPTCPCCGRQSMRPGVRCGACAISCRPEGDGWKRGQMCPAGHRMVEILEDSDEQEEAEELEEIEPIPLRRRPAGFRPALRPPPPIPEGRNAASQGRPAGLRVEPVKQRSVEDTKKLVKVDPIAAVHAGRSGVQF